MHNRLKRVVQLLAYPLNTRPLAVCSVLFFIFTVMRLYVAIQPLLVLVTFIGIVLILLNRAKKVKAFIVVFTMASVIMGTMLANNHIMYADMVMKSFDNCHARIEGYVSSFPDKDSSETTFYVTADKVYSNKGNSCSDIKIFVQTIDVGYSFGDKIVFNGYLTRTDYDKAISKYYIAKGATLRTNDIVLIKKQNGGIIARFLVSIRNKAVSASKKLLKNEAAMLFRAIVAGDKTSFSDDFSNALTKSGISHVACVSGLHVSLVGMGIYNLLKRKKKLAFLISFIAVIVFTVFTGASPSTMRATMMFFVYLLSKVSIRQNDSFTALTLSAAVLSAINPYVIYDWGFILSFLSVLGIEIFAKDFSSWLNFLPRFMRESIAVTLSAQLMSIPALTIMFGHISSYAIVSNIIVSVVFTYALYFSLMFVFVSSIPVIGSVFAVVCTFLLDIICVTAVAIGDLPYSFVGIKPFNMVELVCYYFVVLVYIFRKQIPMKAFNIITLIIIGVLVANYIYIEPSEVEYSLGENSYIYISEDFSKLVLYDDAKSVKNDVISYSRSFDVDYIVANKPVKGEEKVLFELYKLVNAEKIYVNEEYCDASFLNIAEASGIEVKKFSEK